MNNIEKAARNAAIELGFTPGDWQEQKLRKIIRDTIIGENERCAKLVDSQSIVGDMSEPFDACRLNLGRAARAIRDLPIAS